MTAEGKHTPASAPYRGEDRRRVSARPRTRWGADWWIAVALFVVSVFAVALLAEMQSQVSFNTSLVRTILLTTGLVLGVGGAVVGIAVWRLNGDAPAMYSAIGLGILALGAIGGGQLLPLAAPGTRNVIQPSVIHTASIIVASLLFFRAVTVSAVDTRLRAWHVVGLSLIGVAALAAALRPIPVIVRIIGGTARGSDPAAVSLITLVWLTLAIISVMKSRGGRRPMFAWLALTFLTFMTARLVTNTEAPPATMPALLWASMQALGLGFAWWGLVVELLRVYGEASSRVARSEYSASTARQRILSEQAAQEERAHEARSALAAIEGATKTLEHYRDRLPEATQQTLMAGVVEEIRRLQRLVSSPSFIDDVEPFDVTAALKPLIELERARGTEVDTDFPDSVVALGRATDTVQIIQALLDNARRYAGTPVLMDVMPDAEEVHVRVHDRGPGVPEEEREVIFRRGVRGSTALATDGTGLGLAIASQLAAGQGGRLYAQGRQGGGAVFGLVLPVPGAIDLHGRNDVTDVR